jgi:hypothetical protein
MAPYSNYHPTMDRPPFGQQMCPPGDAPVARSYSMDESSSYTTAPLGSPLPTTQVNPFETWTTSNQERDVMHCTSSHEMAEIISSQEQALRQSQLSNSYKHPRTSNQSNTTIVPVGTNMNKPKSTASRILLTEAIHPDKYRMKQKRRDTTAVGIVGGAVVGTMVFPVIGTAIGGAAAGYACNKLSKHSERKAQRQWEQNSFQRQASQSPTVNAVLV